MIAIMNEENNKCRRRHTIRTIERRKKNSSNRKERDEHIFSLGLWLLSAFKSTKFTRNEKNCDLNFSQLITLKEKQTVFLFDSYTIYLVLPFVFIFIHGHVSLSRY